LKKTDEKTKFRLLFTKVHTQSVKVKTFVMMLISNIYINKLILLKMIFFKEPWKIVVFNYIY